MGNFKIEIEAVGGHGYDRNAKPGDAVDFGPRDRTNPDGLARSFVEQLAECVGSGIVTATLTHWPESTPIIDDLLNSKRVANVFGDAGAMFADEKILQFFSFGHLPPPLAAVSRPFCHLAHQLVATLPRSAERTVALRKILEAKDAAVRALIAK